MPWFKVDDTLPFHEKVVMAGNGAMGLWVRAGAWSMQQLTDGHIPTHIARTLGSKREADRLVQSGLWDATESGYTFHAWAPRQPLKAEVEDRREKRREAGKLGGLASGQSRRGGKQT